MTRESSIPWAKPILWGNEAALVSDALASTWISGGPYVERLEREFLALAGSRHALTTSNGTTAIHLAYLALGVKPGDEIIVPGFGFLATANVALQMGAKPVFTEVDPDTWCMRAEDIEQHLTSRTRAIVPVHTYGNMCSMDVILELGRKHGIAVIEDAAEAFPSRYRGRLAGTLGAIGCYSFQATKTITTGEGGMVVTEDPALYDSMTLYRSHGMRRQRYYWHELPGHNFRLTNLQAALGCAQFEKLPLIIRERERVYIDYRNHLSGIGGLALQRFLPEVEAVVWAMAVRLDSAEFPQGRDAVMAQMREAGIETRPGFYAPSMMSFYDCPPLPLCEELSRQILSLPTFPTLQDEQIERICTCLAGLRRKTS